MDTNPYVDKLRSNPQFISMAPIMRLSENAITLFFLLCTPERMTGLLANSIPWDGYVFQEFFRDSKLTGREYSDALSELYKEGLIWTREVLGVDLIMINPGVYSVLPENLRQQVVNTASVHLNSNEKWRQNLKS